MIELPDESFATDPMPNPNDPWLRLQAVRPVPPGTWSLSGVVLDRTGGDAGVARAEITVEETPRDAPRITGPILARTIEESGDAPREGAEPFLLAGHVVVPRMDNALTSLDPFRLFIGVDSPAAAPDTPVALSWNLEHYRGEDSTWETVKTKRLDDARGPRAWQLPAGALPPGRYRLVFEASTPEGVTTERRATFSVSGRAPQPRAPTSRAR